MTQRGKLTGSGEMPKSVPAVTSADTIRRDPTYDELAAKCGKLMAERQQAIDERDAWKQRYDNAASAVDLLVEHDPDARKLKEADDLLRQFAEWDMFSPSSTIPIADAPYWLAEIKRVRALLGLGEP